MLDKWFCFSTNVSELDLQEDFRFHEFWINYGTLDNLCRNLFRFHLIYILRFLKWILCSSYYAKMLKCAVVIQIVGKVKYILLQGYSDFYIISISLPIFRNQNITNSLVFLMSIIIVPLFYRSIRRHRQLFIIVIEMSYSLLILSIFFSANSLNCSFMGSPPMRCILDYRFLHSKSQMPVPTRPVPRRLR